MTSESQYERDLEIIDAATDGEWYTKYSSNGPRILVRPECMQDMISIVDAEYIAHFNPSYTRQLVTELEELRNACGDLLSLINRIAPNVDYDEVKKAKEVLK